MDGSKISKPNHKAVSNKFVNIIIHGNEILDLTWISSLVSANQLLCNNNRKKRYEFELIFRENVLNTKIEMYLCSRN